MGKVELQLAVDAELVAEARSRGLRLDAALEDGLRSALARDEAAHPGGFAETAAMSPLDTLDERARQWAEENAEAIKAHRERIEQYGVFGDDLRTW